MAPLILRFHFCRCYLQDAAGWLGFQVPPPDGVAQRFTSLYGTAELGGVYGAGNNPGGTIFKITPAGAFTTLYSFCAQPNCADGFAPFGGLVQGADGNFYGTTQAGGTNDPASCNQFNPQQGCGTVFKITPAGTLATLHDFGGADGAEPFGLMQSTNGVFYGPTFLNGTTDSACYAGCGTVFSLAVGLRPFVETLPTSGKVGETIKILGNELTNATSVSFNGTPAAFTVESKTLISATVTAGAITGFVTVTGPNATLKSNVKFRVRQ